MSSWRSTVGRKRGSGRKWTRETSALAHAAKARKRLAGPAPEYPPLVEAGRLLHRIRVESFVAGTGFEVEIRQAARSNQIVAVTFGRASRRPHGFDLLFRRLRQRLVQGVPVRVSKPVPISQP